MADKRCDNGHFIDESWDLCPYCPQDDAEPEGALAVVRVDEAEGAARTAPPDADTGGRRPRRGSAGGVLVQLGAPELEPRLAPRLRRGETGALEVRGARLPVEAELFRHLRLDVRPPADPPPERAAARDQPRDHRPLS